MKSNTATHPRLSLDSVTNRLSGMYSGARDKVVAGAKATDSKIRDKPYHSLAIAAGVGVLLGLLVGRRSRR